MAEPKHVVLVHGEKGKMYVFSIHSWMRYSKTFKNTGNR